MGGFRKLRVLGLGFRKFGVPSRVLQGLCRDKMRLGCSLSKNEGRFWGLIDSALQV